MKYLFVTEGGEQIFVSNQEPTLIDLQCVRDGTLNIVKLSDLTFLMCEGQDLVWRELEVGSVANTPEGSYHYNP